MYLFAYSHRRRVHLFQDYFALLILLANRSYKYTCSFRPHTHIRSYHQYQLAGELLPIQYGITQSLVALCGPSRCLLERCCSRPLWVLNLSPLQPLSLLIGHCQVSPVAKCSHFHVLLRCRLPCTRTRARRRNWFWTPSCARYNFVLV